MTPSEFLSARLDEEEQAANAALIRPGNRWIAPHLAEGTPKGISNHIARHSPIRVLRDITAKRLILKEWQEALDRTDEHGRPAHMFDPVLSMLVNSHQGWIRHLASAYADHPDYMEAISP